MPAFLVFGLAQAALFLVGEAFGDAPQQFSCSDSFVKERKRLSFGETEIDHQGVPNGIKSGMPHGGQIAPVAC